MNSDKERDKLAMQMAVALVTHYGKDILTQSNYLCYKLADQALTIKETEKHGKPSSPL